MNRDLKNKTSNFFVHVIVIAIGFIMLYPILWLIFSSFKPNEHIFSDVSLIPKKITLEHYVDGWQGIGRIPFSRFLKNSFFVSIMSVIVNVISCSMVAYAFGRLDFSLKNIWFAIMMLSIMLPTHVTNIPRYVMFNKFGWIDTYYPLIIPKILATDGFFIFLLVQFIRGIPTDLDESATIEGCGPIQIYWRIIMPLAKPALVTTALFTFLWTWDDFFNPLIYLNTPEKFTVPLGLRMFLDSTGESNWGSMFAMSVVSLIPSFILFLTMQNYFVEGITTTGIKG